MIENYEFQLLNNNLYQTENFLQILSKLEKLEVIRDNIFNKINTGISSRVAKLENIKSRIIRANQAIASYNRTQALTIRSKRYYPEAIYIYSNPITFNINAKANEKKPEEPLNTNVKVGQYIGKMPKETIEDTLIVQSLYNIIPPFKDVFETLSKELQMSGLKESSEFNPVINYMNSYFNFMTKDIIDQKRKAQFKDQSLSFFYGLDSFIISDNWKQKQKAKPQDAPISIIQKDKLQHYVKKKNVNFQHFNNNLTINLPQNINLLGNIADFDLNSSIATEEIIDNKVNITDLLEEDDTSNYNPNEFDFCEDLPFELIQSKKADATKKSSSDANASNVPTTSPTYTNYIPTTPATTNQSNSIPSVPSNTQTQPLISLNLNQPKIVSGSAPSIPIPPPIPSFSVVAKPTATTNNSEKPSQNKEKPEKKKEEDKKIEQEEDRKDGDKEGLNEKPEKKKEEDKKREQEEEEDRKDGDTEGLKEKPEQEERGKTLEELIGDNPIAKLKKIPTKDELAEIEAKKEQDKKDNSPKKLNQQGLIDHLKDQIQLRYKNLRKHQEISDSGSDSD